MIKVLIADNHPIVRLGIKNVLQSADDFEVIDDELSEYDEGCLSVPEKLPGFYVD